MTQIEFCYWLKGYFELSKATSLTDEQVAEIKRHLGIVFNQPLVIPIQTPSYGTIYCNNVEVPPLQSLPQVSQISHASC